MILAYWSALKSVSGNGFSAEISSPACRLEMMVSAPTMMQPPLLRTLVLRRCHWQTNTVGPSHRGAVPPTRRLIVETHRFRPAIGYPRVPMSLNPSVLHSTNWLADRFRFVVGTPSEALRSGSLTNHEQFRK